MSWWTDGHPCDKIEKIFERGDSMEIGLLQYDVLRDREANLQKAEAFLEKNQCDLLLLPELSMCGYLFESRKALESASEAVPGGASTKAMCALSRAHDCTIVFGLAEGEGIYNTAVVVSRGSYVGKYRKIHLSDLEKKLFDRGRENPVFEVGGLKIGAQICFDLWFPEISREQLRQGAEVLCVLANFGGDTTYHISRIRAIENLTPLVLCNRVGRETIPGMEADFLGKSTAIDPSGQRVYVAPAGAEDGALCRIETGQPHANVICRDFDREMGLHYPDPEETERRI